MTGKRLRERRGTLSRDAEKLLGATKAVSESTRLAAVIRVQVRCKEGATKRKPTSIQSAKEWQWQKSYHGFGARR